MSIIISIICVLVTILGIISVINAERLNKLQEDYYDVEERALSHFKKIMKLNNMIKKYEAEGKHFMALEDIKRAINQNGKH